LEHPAGLPLTVSRRQFPDFGNRRRIRDVTTCLLTIQAREVDQIEGLLSPEQHERVDAIVDKERLRAEAAKAKRRPDDFDEENKLYMQEAEVGVDPVFMVKASRRRYLERYKEELVLNDLLHNYTRNLEKVYK
jgi:hypothetical protein